VRLFYCDHRPLPLPEGHKFPIAKYRLLRNLLEADGFFRLEPAPLADRAAIERAHDPGYVRAFLEGSIDARAMKRIGFPWSEELVTRTLASSGGTLAAAADAVATGFGGTLAGGTHHAFRHEGSGFCVFNDIAIAVLALGRRAAVIDLDVHQGDGTASIFAGDPRVFTLSLHGERNFPLRKERGSVDVALPDGAGDERYLAELARVLPLAAAFRPEAIFYQSGVDALAGDRLGRLALTHAGLAARDRTVCELARRLGVPLVVTLGGGYAEPIERTAVAHANTFRTAAAVFG
jgi:acetoin utilization deacetylase AcuC-like enzyme